MKATEFNIRGTVGDVVPNELNYSLARLLVPIALATFLCLAMLVTRLLISGKSWHLYLAWNLFLAWFPVGLAYVTCYVAQRESRRTRWTTWIFGAGWLLFFPNAPYVLTDLIHLKPAPLIPLWYDALMFTAFGVTCSLLGFVSLGWIKTLIDQRRGLLWGWASVIVILLLSSFGIYLGRFMRWNSWDAVLQPGAFFNELFRWFSFPQEVKNASIFVAVFTSVLFVGFIVTNSLTAYAPGQLRFRKVSNGAGS